MEKELKGNLFLVLPERKQVLEIKFYNGEFDLGGRKISDMYYVSYRSFNMGNNGRGTFFGKMITNDSPSRMSAEDLASKLIQHIYGSNAHRVMGYVVKAA